jgi:hypothetical protein
MQYFTNISYGLCLSAYVFYYKLMQFLKIDLSKFSKVDGLSQKTLENEVKINKYYSLHYIDMTTRQKKLACL